MDKHVFKRLRTRIPTTVIRARGQSIPLIAMMLVVLIGLVALSVDVGNTYSEQRHATRAADAAAVYGMQTYMATSGDDAAVIATIMNSFEANGIEVVTDTALLTPDNRLLRAHYLDSSGNAISESTQIGDWGSNVANAHYIRIMLDGEVETSFARVFGFDTLAVDTVSWSGQCPPINGVLPFVINNGIIDPNPPEKYYPLDTDGIVAYQDLAADGNMPYKRFEFGPITDPEVHIGMVRWRDEYNASDFHDMLEAAGLLRLGFEEVRPWPGDSSLPIDEPELYPSEPSNLQENDWVYGLRYQADPANPGMTAPYTVDLQAMDSLLEYHRNNRTKMILPLYNYVVPAVGDDSNNPAYNIGQFGEFYLFDYDVSTPGDEWLELVFIGFAPRIPCPSENIEVASTFGVQGNIDLLPFIPEAPDNARPAAYTIMLDVSGSMTLNFDGLGEYQGQFYQCEANDPVLSDQGILYSYEAFPFPNGSGDCANNNHYGLWEDPSHNPPHLERRSFASRQAIMEIINDMAPTERIRFVAFDHGIDEVSDQWYHPVNDYTDLRDEVQTVGEESCGCAGCGDYDTSPCYVTSGGTNGASALNRAWDIMEANDFPNGDHRRVAIYMTDGVSNRGIGGTRGVRGVANGDHPDCNGLETNEKKNTAWCQLGYDASGNPRPITQMQLLADKMRQTFNDRANSDSTYEDHALFVVAMGRIDTTGLDQVASNGVAYQAGNSAQLESLLQDIQTQVEQATCTAKAQDRVVWIRDGNRRDPNLLPNEASDVHGLIDIHQNGNFVKTVEIRNIDEPGRPGRLGFMLPIAEGLAPGTYQMTNARVFYKVQTDWGEEHQVYNRIEYSDGSPGPVQFTISPRSELGEVVQVPDITLRLEETYFTEICDRPAL